MAGLILDRFDGLIPRIPAALLPPSHATEATNCDFAYGELRPTRSDLFIKNLANTAASVYTDNGLTFYSWPEDVNAVRSPQAVDPYDRLYYTTPTDFRVTTRSGMGAGGGAPAASYRVGVPRPTKAPKLSISALSPLSDATLTATFHYEYNGTKYQEQAIALTVLTPLAQWTYTPPAIKYTPPTVDPDSGQSSEPKPDETPTQAVPVVRLKAKNTDGSVLLDVYTANSYLQGETGWTLSSTKTGNAGAYTIDLAPTASEVALVARTYAYTLVNTYGEEGPPSPAATLTLNSALHADVVVELDPPAADYAPIKEIRIYRTADSQAGDDYFYTGAVQVLGQNPGSFILQDKTPADSLNETLVSLNSYPPDPLLVGLIALPNGILMAWKGNKLCFSDAYRPWSWPPQYEQPFGDNNIVGAIPIGSGALVTTTGKPFAIAGITPDTMTASNINIEQAGVSKWSMATAGGMVVYASNDGLIAISGLQPVADFSGRYFTRQVWKDKYATGLDTMRFALWDGRLIVYSSARKFVPFMLSLDEAGGAMTELPDLVAACSFTSPLSDQCYLVNGSALLQFAGGAEATAGWTSREINQARSVSFGVAKAKCSGSWTVRFYAGGTLRWVEPAITGESVFRLPDGDTEEDWQIRVEGTGRFKKLLLATTMRELEKM
jgi:hypothetical protein